MKGGRCGQIDPPQKKLPSKSRHLLELTPALAKIIQMYQDPNVDITLQIFKSSTFDRSISAAFTFICILIVLYIIG